MSEPAAKITRTCALAAAALTLALFLRALTCGFLNWDDPEYVLEKMAIRHLDPALLFTAFTQPLVALWKPLTFISYAVDYRIWGLNPLGYHLTNIVLHAVNTALVVLIAGGLYRISSGGEEAIRRKTFLYPGMLLLAGLLFGIHPLRVESVAWISARKDVLNGLFSLGCVLWYLRYAEKREVAGPKRFPVGNYLVCLLLFLCSLMSKPVSVVIPVLLLVADWYPLDRLRKGRIGAVLAEKVPFLLGAAAVTVINLKLVLPRGELPISTTTLSLGQKLLLTGNALFEYLRLMLYPVRIEPFYVIPTPIPATYALKTAAVAAICAGVWLARKQKSLAAIWLCFVVSLLPMLPPFQVSASAYAARYTYLASVVPSIAAAVLVARLAAKGGTGDGGYRRLILASMLVLPILYGVLTERLIGAWHDSLTLWSDAVASNPDNYFAWDAVGGEYRSAGRTRDAALAFERGLALNPNDGSLLFDSGDFCTELGEVDRGYRQLKKLLEMNPTHVMGWASLGSNRVKAGDYRAAEKAYRQALALQPDAPQVLELLGDLARTRGRLDNALVWYRKAETKGGNDPDSAYRLACLHCQMGRNEEALTWLEKSLQRGFRDYGRVGTDKALSPLWNDPRFNYLMVRYFPAGTERADR